MIDSREILEAASSFSLLPNVVEKDYVLGWILGGINAHDEHRSRCSVHRVHDELVFEPFASAASQPRTPAPCILLNAYVITRGATQQPDVSS
jgi:hypothetical protein